VRRRAMRYISGRRWNLATERRYGTPMRDTDAKTRAEMIRLEPYTQTSPLMDVALHVYAAVWPGRDPARAGEGLTRHGGYDGVCGFVGYHGDEAAGVGYGASSVPGIWWHDHVTPVLGMDHPALHDAWRLVELAVMAEHRRLGIGGQLHDTLLAVQPCP